MDFLVEAPTGSAIADGTVVFAHGSGAPMDSPFMTSFATGLAARGLRTVRFEFPYMAERRATGRKRPPNPMPQLLRCWREVLCTIDGPVVIGGKSMGGRVASMVAGALEKEATPVAGVACLGYPFHPPGRPDRMRVDHLMTLRTPTIILQGTRDPFGPRDEVPDFGLPSRIDICWLEDGDHSFKPRRISGLTERQNWNTALDRLSAFAETVLG